MSAAEVLDMVRRLALQRGFDLLRNHAATEGAGEDVTDSTLEAAFESRNDPHRPSSRVRTLPRVKRAACLVSWQRGRHADMACHRGDTVIA